MKYLLRGKEIYTENQVLGNASILVENGNIESVEIKEIECKEVIDAGKYKVLPGLIDIHIHGANGHDTMDATFDSLNGISKFISSYGVTAFLPTTVTARWNKIKKAVTCIEQTIVRGVDGAEVLGANIEGPFITSEHRGAHPKDYIREIDFEEIDELFHLSKNIKIMTVAPEKSNAIELIKLLKSKDIVASLGHTNATYEETTVAIDNGATLAVHTYNGMRGLDHREPAVLGTILSNDKIFAELIADIVHVHPAAIKILLKCKGKDKICLITDCMRAGGLKDGEYALGELKVVLKNSVARIENGSLAGSTLNLIDAIKNMVEKADLDLLDVVNMSTLVPARILGLDKEIGSIEAGKKANFTIIDKNFNVVMTIVKGKIVYRYINF